MNSQPAPEGKEDFSAACLRKAAQLRRNARTLAEPARQRAALRQAERLERIAEASEHLKHARNAAEAWEKVLEENLAAAELGDNIKVETNRAGLH